jgi:hypothetical protein
MHGIRGRGSLSKRSRSKSHNAAQREPLKGEREGEKERRKRRRRITCFLVERKVVLRTLSALGRTLVLISVTFSSDIICCVRDRQRTRCSVYARAHARGTLTPRLNHSKVYSLARQ